MSSDGSVEEESATEVVFKAEIEDLSSEEPPMSEWSSLVIKLKEDNVKMKLYEEGLYDPGSGEICTAYVAQSDSTVFRHPYYNYPTIKNPGIEEALLQPPPKVTYPNDGQELYLVTCKTMNQVPVRMFHRCLVETHINLSYYGVNPNGVRAMAMALQNNNHVTHLDLTDNWLNDDACFHLGRMLLSNAKLVDLNLYGCRIGPSGALRICDSLPTNRALRALNLGRNKIGDEGLSYLARAVELLSDIREINLSCNEITGKGAHCLAEALDSHNKLTYVDLSYNYLYSFQSGICNLLNHFGMNPEFQYLNISWNSLSGQNLARSIKRMFEAKLLSHVDLSYNKLGGTVPIQTIASALTKPNKLVTLNLAFNPLSPADALLIINQFQSSTCKIKILNLDGVTVNESFADILAKTKAERDLTVTHGYVQGGFKFTGPDPRETLLNRVEYVGKKNKKRSMDIALVVLQLLKDNIELCETKELNYKIKPTGVVLDEDLLNEIQRQWPGPPTKKGGKRIDLKLLGEYISRKWPERKLPPTPPPEPEPVPVPKKGKGKKQKK